MNDKHQETGASRALLILTIPAYGFVVAMRLDCLGQAKRAAFAAETLRRKLNRSIPSGLEGSPTPQGLCRGYARWLSRSRVVGRAGVCEAGLISHRYLARDNSLAANL